MKKSLLCLVLSGLFMILPVMVIDAYAGDWILYDDFESGAIDTSKWNVDDSSANISVEGGRARFDVLSGPTNDSSSLAPNRSRSTIIGIKADVTVGAGCEDTDIRGRIGAYVGRNGSGFEYWHSQNYRPSETRISYGASYDDGTGLWWDVYYGAFSSLDLSGNTYTGYVLFGTENVTNHVESVGTDVYTYAPSNTVSLADRQDSFNSIGTRTYSGTGSCTYYFDNVYVKRADIALKTQNGQYVAANNGGGSEVVAWWDTIGGWETFEYNNIGGMNRTFRTPTGHYLSAINGGGGEVRADATTVGAWETFEIVYLTGEVTNEYAFKTSTGHYLSAIDGGGGAVRADATAVGAWENFSFHTQYP